MEGLRADHGMRKRGRELVVQSIFDGYNEMLVQLSDEHVTEMYKNFMLIYVDEADDDACSSGCGSRRRTSTRRCSASAR